MPLSEATVLSLAIGVLVGLSAGYLGSLMVLEKMALVGDALSHVALPGMALGLLFGFQPFLGAFAFLFVSTILIWQVQRVTKLSFETLVGAVFTLALAVGILIIPEPELLEALFGSISDVGIVDLGIAAIVSLATIGLTRIVYTKVVLSLLSEELATSHGIKVARTNLLYLVLVSLVVAVGIKITGTLLVGFLVVTPAASARIVSTNLARYTLLSAVLGASSAALGILFSAYSRLAPGPVVVLCGVLFFVLAFVIRTVAPPSGG